MKPNGLTATDIVALIDAKGELRLRVIPGAKVEKMAVENGTLKIWIRTAPEDGKANKTVVAQIADLLSLPVANIRMLQGQSSRDKRLYIALG